MDHDVAIETTFERDGVQFTGRDARLLRAIDEVGTLSGAADALGRSYSRAQQRIVELESAYGPLVERKRGGTDGGGSTLTAAAVRLCRQFDRITTELNGRSTIETTILDGTVTSTTGTLGTVETDVGAVRAIVPPDHDRVAVVIRADAVTLFAPGRVPAGATSAQNRLSGTVSSISDRDGRHSVAVTVGPATTLTAQITPASATRLSLTEGRELIGAFKATATRAVPKSD